MKSITFGITTHNEGQNIQKLVTEIQKRDFPIVILDDFSTDEETKSILANLKDVEIHQKKFNNDFAQHKNYLNSLCKSEMIFQLDGDELLTEMLLNNIQVIVNENDVDLIWVPRVNIVEGLTVEYATRCGWSITTFEPYKEPINCWPDYQGRIYKSKLEWIGHVHERISGAQKIGQLPEDHRWAIIHRKSFDKQVKQNQFYEEIGKYFDD